MPTYVNPNACNACAEEHLGPLCVYICPNDLMVLDVDQNKGLNQEEAIHVRGYADFVPLGAEVQPHRVDMGLPAVKLCPVRKPSMFAVTPTLCLWAPKCNRIGWIWA